MRKKFLAGFLAATMMASSVFATEVPVEPVADVPTASEETTDATSDSVDDTFKESNQPELQQVASEYTQDSVVVDGITYPLNYINEYDFVAKPLSEDTLDRSLENALPSAYWSPVITSIKNQNPYGTCWAFSAMAAAESSAWKRGIVANQDFSELQFAYFYGNPVNEPMGGFEGDGSYVGSQYADYGGNAMMSAVMLSAWQGPIPESKAPYSALLSNSGVTLHSQYAYSQDALHLENAYVLSGYDKTAIKTMLQKYGAASISYYHNNSFFNGSTYATYQNQTARSNHAVTLVGWNDNYSRNNFGRYKPENNGAWLVKNSWGSSWGNNGLFWLSYEDVGFLSRPVVFYEYGKSNNYDYNYQYDGCVTHGGVTYSRNSGFSANVFTSKHTETLGAVGYWTAEPNYKSLVKVYKNPTTGNPASGTLVYSKTVTDAYTGYHTLKLDKVVSLKSGDKFSVVVESWAMTAGEDVDIYVEKKSEIGYFGIKSGQSYVSYSGRSGWEDLYDSGVGNVGIKAYTKKIDIAKIQAFVTRIYTKALGRAAEAGGLNYWTEQIATRKFDPTTVAQYFIISAEFEKKKTTNTQYVTILYRTFMDREPDAAGLNYWVNRLNKGESRKTVLRSFAGCPEFQKIIASYGL